MKLDHQLLQSILPAECSFEGNTELVFGGMQSAFECEAGEITWIKSGIKDEAQLLNSLKATGIVCSPASRELFEGDLNAKLLIVHPNPRLIFQIIIKYIYDLKNGDQSGTRIHPTAIVDPDCTMGENVSIGAYCVIGACNIGDGVVIHDHVKIFDCVTIGDHCLIREFCSIGGEGFGFIKNSDGLNERIPHIGSVLIEDHVCIYPFSNVDRGTLSTTTIKSHTVIDHYVHMGHNTTTGENNIIAAGTVLAGGAQIEDNCFIGVKTTLRENAKVGSNVLTGMGTVVLKDIPDNEIWVGNPGRFLKNNE